MDPQADDAATLEQMRRLAEGLAMKHDPLLTGAVAQLVGLIDALLAIGAPPDAGRVDPRARRRQ